MRILVTGGAGFIGSALIRHLILDTGHSVLNLDKLTYAGNLESLASVDDNPRYQFLQADIADRERVSEALLDFQPDAIMHLAAESHVDRSIDGPAEFVQTVELKQGDELLMTMQGGISISENPVFRLGYAPNGQPVTAHAEDTEGRAWDESFPQAGG